MEESKMKTQLTIYMEEAQKELLSSLAKKDGRTLTSYITNILPQPRGKK
jgi:predicted DNA-binding protein